MEPSDILNCAIRVKEEPSDASLSEHNSEMIDEKPDFKNFQFLSFPPEHSTDRKCEANHESELSKEVEIVVECKDVKPNFDSDKKIDDYSSNYSRNAKDSNGYKIQKIIKIEPAEKVKQDLVCRDVEALNILHNITGYACNICNKKFANKGGLSRHIKSLHDRITQTFDKSGKSFTRKHNLNNHINKITYPCDICQKNFTQKSNLKGHFDAVHTGVTHTCDACGKTFTWQSSLKVHVDVVHNGVQNSCKICGKKLVGNFQRHINSVHNGITFKCNTCGKSFTEKGSLKNHTDSAHNGLVSTCDHCGKKFKTKTYLKCHIDAVHKGIGHACNLCGKKCTTKSNLKSHINSVHRSRIRNS